MLDGSGRVRPLPKVFFLKFLRSEATEARSESTRRFIKGVGW